MALGRHGPLSSLQEKELVSPRAVASTAASASLHWAPFPVGGRAHADPCPCSSGQHGIRPHSPAFISESNQPVGPQEELWVLF